MHVIFVLRPTYLPLVFSSSHVKNVPKHGKQTVKKNQ